MSELERQLVAIEADLDDGRYRTGPWDRFVRTLRAQPRSERLALAADVNRVSRKLHANGNRRTVSLRAGIALEVLGTAVGGAAVAIGLATGSSLLIAAAAVIWVTTFEPLLKVGVGALLGVRYEYAYLRGIEPRFKMRYGAYLAAPRWVRIAVHFSGTLGSPIAAWLVGRLVRSRMAVAASLCMGACWALFAANALLFCFALTGYRRLGPIKLSATSGGAAALELREGLTGKTT